MSKQPRVYKTRNIVDTSHHHMTRAEKRDHLLALAYILGTWKTNELLEIHPKSTKEFAMFHEILSPIDWITLVVIDNASKNDRAIGIIPGETCNMLKYIYKRTMSKQKDGSMIKDISKGLQYLYSPFLLFLFVKYLLKEENDEMYLDFSGYTPGSIHNIQQWMNDLWKIKTNVSDSYPESLGIDLKNCQKMLKIVQEDSFTGPLYNLLYV